VRDHETETNGCRGNRSQHSWRSGIGRWRRFGKRRPRAATIRSSRRQWRAALGRTRWPRLARPPRRTSGRTRWPRLARSPRRTRTMAWGSPAWLLPRGAVGRRTGTLGMGCAAAADVGRTPATSRGAVGRWPNQLLGLPGNTLLESRVQPVGFQFLWSLDPAVEDQLTRRPLRRLASRASCTHPSDSDRTYDPRDSRFSLTARKPGELMGVVAVDELVAGRVEWRSRLGRKFSSAGPSTPHA
jgi:hypothetical protein